jgi:outer membrane protein OmpA-like peptidoglycan-associated protein
MQKNILVIILIAAFCTAMTAGCAGKNWTKNTGTYPTKTVARAGGLPDLIVDPRISDTGVVKEPVRTAKTKSDSAKQKSYAAIKEAEENLSLLLTIEFDFAKYFIREQYNDDIKKVADTMKENPKAKAVIKGHTDSIGSKAYNMRLSKDRANSLKKYIVSRFGIKSSRIATAGYAFDKPVAGNDTEEGRQKNRRDEIFIKEQK